MSLIEKDVYGIRQIGKKTKQLANQSKRNQDQLDLRRSHQLKVLASQHERWSELEAKCGLVKYRDEPLQSMNSFRSSTYGFSRMHSVSSRTEVLSRPKPCLTPKDPLKHFDYRGMMSADFKGVIEFYKPESPTLKPILQPILQPAKHVVKPARIIDTSQVEDDLRSIEQVEKICRNTSETPGYPRAELAKYYQTHSSLKNSPTNSSKAV